MDGDMEIASADEPVIDDHACSDWHQKDSVRAQGKG